MAVYNAGQGYSVNIGKGDEAYTIVFDYFGKYETNDIVEIAALDTLVPTWITKESESEPEPKTPAKPKASAK